MRLVLRQLGGLAVGKRATALSLGGSEGGAGGSASGRVGAEPATSSKEEGEATLTFDALRLRVAEALDRLEDADRLKLVHKGKVLKPYLALPAFRDGDVISYAFSLRAPDEYLRERVDGGFEEQEERELRFDIEKLESRWQQKAASYLRHTLQCPDSLLWLLFSILPTSRRSLILLALWLAGAKASHSHELGPIYLVASIGGFILLNLGRRREGEASAYSIFNDFQALPGQLTADQIEGQMVRGRIT
mmetsp:Transcript_3688/g.9597  ORF Transcript_3688/g.9597 Transcript_3688/m.9597 type:complete len:247 (-) Transcript_3688:69-809(-)